MNIYYVFGFDERYRDRLKKQYPPMSRFIDVTDNYQLIYKAAGEGISGLFINVLNKDKQEEIKELKRFILEREDLGYLEVRFVKYYMDE